MTQARPRRSAAFRFPQLAGHAVVLARREGEWQLGVEPGRAVVLAGVQLPVLELLDGRHPMELVRARARSAGLRPGELDRTLAALHEAGLLAERAAASPAPPTRIRLVGAGPIGHQLAGLLVAGGTSTSLYVFDDQPPEAALYPTAGPLGSRAQALCAQLVDATPAGRPRSSGPLAVKINHWSKPENASVDLTVIASERPEVDRVVTDHLLRMDQPHLLVRAHDLGVSVGPLVVPGRTSCVQCADLTRRDADPQWPTVLAQLTRLTQTPPPALVSWAAAVAATQVLAFLAGGAVETAGATLELGRPDFATRRRSWAVHPGCGCGWSVPTEWGA